MVIPATPTSLTEGTWALPAHLIRLLQEPVPSDADGLHPGACPLCSLQHEADLYDHWLDHCGVEPYVPPIR